MAQRSTRYRPRMRRDDRPDLAHEEPLPDEAKARLASELGHLYNEGGDSIIVQDTPSPIEDALSGDRPVKVRLYSASAPRHHTDEENIEFIADTGTSFFILPEEELSPATRKRIHTLSSSIAMSTVNGPLDVDQGVSIRIPNLDRRIDFVVVKDSPPLLSIGRLCMIEGFGFSGHRGRLHGFRVLTDVLFPLLSRILFRIAVPAREVKRHSHPVL